MDHLTAQQRHANMAAIRSKDTKPEMIVRKGLWSRGFRYLLNYKRLPGHPDLVLRKYRTCIFVNGCFWYGHMCSLTPSLNSVVNGDSLPFVGPQPHSVATLKAPVAPKGEGRIDLVGSACCKIPNTNREFWVAKIRRNQERDKEEQRKLAAMGWHCITVWECELKTAKREATLDSIAFTLNHIWLQDHGAKSKPYVVPEEEYLMAAESEEELK